MDLDTPGATSADPLRHSPANHSYGTRTRKNTFIRPSSRLRQSDSPPPHARRVKLALRALTKTAQHLSPNHPPFPPPNVVLHPDDANSKVFLAIGRAFCSVDNRAMTIKDLAEMTMKFGLLCQNVSAASQAITTYIRAHMARCEDQDDHPLLLRHVLSGTSADDDLLPALHSRMGGAHCTTSTSSEKRPTNFRRGTTVWYLSRVTGSPCPFARAGISLCDRGGAAAARAARRASEPDHRQDVGSRGQKRKRFARRRASSPATLSEDSLSSSSDAERHLPKVKLTLRLRPLTSPLSSALHSSPVGRTDPVTEPTKDTESHAETSSDEEDGEEDDSEEGDSASHSEDSVDDEDENDDEDDEESLSSATSPSNASPEPCFVQNEQPPNPHRQFRHPSLLPDFLSCAAPSRRRSLSCTGSFASLPPDSEEDDGFTRELEPSAADNGTSFGWGLPRLLRLGHYARSGSYSADGWDGDEDFEESDVELLDHDNNDGDSETQWESTSPGPRSPSAFVGDVLVKHEDDVEVLFGPSWDDHRFGTLAAVDTKPTTRFPFFDTSTTTSTTATATTTATARTHELEMSGEFDPFEPRGDAWTFAATPLEEFSWFGSGSGADEEAAAVRVKQEEQEPGPLGLGEAEVAPVSPGSRASSSSWDGEMWQQQQGQEQEQLVRRRSSVWRDVELLGPEHVSPTELDEWQESEALPPPSTATTMTMVCAEREMETVRAAKPRIGLTLPDFSVSGPEVSTAVESLLSFSSGQQVQGLPKLQGSTSSLPGPLALLHSSSPSTPGRMDDRALDQHAVPQAPAVAMHAAAPTSTPAHSTSSPPESGATDTVVVHTCQPCTPLVSATHVEGISVYQTTLGHTPLLRRIDTDFVNLSPIIEYLGVVTPPLAALPNATLVAHSNSSYDTAKSSSPSSSTPGVPGVWVPLWVAQTFAREPHHQPLPPGLLEVFLSDALFERFPPALRDFHQTNTPLRALHQFGPHFGAVLSGRGREAAVTPSALSPSLSLEEKEAGALKVEPLAGVRTHMPSDLSSSTAATAAASNANAYAYAGPGGREWWQRAPVSEWDVEDHMLSTHPPYPPARPELTSLLVSAEGAPAGAAGAGVLATPLSETEEEMFHVLCADLDEWEWEVREGVREAEKAVFPRCALSPGPAVVAVGDDAVVTSVPQVMTAVADRKEEEEEEEEGEEGGEGEEEEEEDKENRNAMDAERVGVEMGVCQSAAEGPRLLRRSTRVARAIAAAGRGRGGGTGARGGSTSVVALGHSRRLTRSQAKAKAAT